MSKQFFLASARPIAIEINGVPCEAVPRQFSTGSCGYFANGKAPIKLPDGSVGKLQVSANLVIVGSKEWAESTPAKAEKAAA